MDKFCFRLLEERVKLPSLLKVKIYKSKVDGACPIAWVFNLLFSIAQLFGMLFLLGWALNQSDFSLGLGVETPTFYTGLLAFSILFTPISFLIGMLQNNISRIMEYQADAYAKETYDGDALISALKKLSVDSLSNLNPHPAYVFFYYSHPPIHQRIKALN